MRRGIFGFDIWFYGIVALLLAWKKKGLLTVSLASAAAVFLVEQVLHLLSL